MTPEEHTKQIEGAINIFMAGDMQLEQLRAKITSEIAKHEVETRKEYADKLKAALPPDWTLEENCYDA